MEVNKGTAILLAVLFGFWAWLYTFGKDAWKFWVCLGVNAIGLLIVFLSQLEIRAIIQENKSLPPGQFADATPIIVLEETSVFIIIFLWSVTWLLALLNAIFLKRHAKYQKNKIIAVLLAVLFGPFGWFYTFGKDAKKFWIGIVILIIWYFLLSQIFGSDMLWNFRRVVRGHSTLSQVWNQIDFINPWVYYFSEGIKPIRFLISFMVWLSAVASSIVTYIRWDKYAHNTVDSKQ